MATIVPKKGKVINNYNGYFYVVDIEQMRDDLLKKRTDKIPTMSQLLIMNDFSVGFFSAARKRFKDSFGEDNFENLKWDDYGMVSKMHMDRFENAFGLPKDKYYVAFEEDKKTVETIEECDYSQKFDDLTEAVNALSEMINALCGIVVDQGEELRRLEKQNMVLTQKLYELWE